MADGFETILLTIDDGIATLTLNRPDKRNAVDLRMTGELHAAFAALRDDDAVREAARIAVRRRLREICGKRPKTEIHLVRV